MDFPPPNFHLSDFVFRPGISFVPRPGLAERIQILKSEGRLRSALEPLLAILSEQPHDQEALMLALIVVGGGRTDHVHASEALGPRHLLDRRLDPIFAVCSHCHKSTWPPHNCLAWGMSERIHVSNPAGLQCRACGYVVCRNCYGGMTACPNCHAASLLAPVLPTGRVSSQLERRAKPVAATIVLREGPLRPDGEWLTNLFERLSPDVLEDRGRLFAYPAHPWPKSAEGLANALAARASAEGALGDTVWSDTVAAEIMCPDGLRAYVLKMYG